MVRQLSDIEKYNMEFLDKKGIPYVSVFMTDNILSHSIFDASRQMVVFLQKAGIHDFRNQVNGKEGKAFVKTHILMFDKELQSQTSLYKAGGRGDKRMWFGSEILPITDSNDVYFVFAFNSELFIINGSHIDIEYCCTTGIENPIKAFILSQVKKTSY